jgi:hypothetical protein
MAAAASQQRPTGSGGFIAPRPPQPLFPAAATKNGPSSNTAAARGGSVGSIKTEDIQQQHGQKEPSPNNDTTMLPPVSRQRLGKKCIKISKNAK